MIFIPWKSVIKHNSKEMPSSFGIFFLAYFYIKLENFGIWKEI